MAERSEAAPPAGPMIGFGLYRFRDCVGGGVGERGKKRAAKKRGERVQKEGLMGQKRVTKRGHKRGAQRRTKKGAKRGD